MGPEVVVNEAAEHQHDRRDKCDIEYPHGMTREPIELAPGEQGCSGHNRPEQIATLMRGQAEKDKPENEPAEKKSFEAADRRFNAGRAPDAPKAINAEQAPGRSTGQIIQGRLI